MGWFRRTPPWRSQLEAVMAPAVAVDRTLAGDVVEHLATGRCPDVTARIAALVGRDPQKWVAAVSGHVQQDRHRTFYRVAGDLPADVLARWAQVLDTSLGSHWQGWWAFPPIAGGRWPETLLVDVQHSFEAPSGVEFAVVEAAVVSGGGRPGELLSALFTAPRRYHIGLAALAVRGLAGYPDAVVEQAARVRPAFTASGVADRQHALAMLTGLSPDQLVVFAEPVAHCAVAGSAQVRADAVALVRRMPQAASRELRRLAASGTPVQRGAALRLLWDLAEDEPARDDLRRQAASDRSATVQGLAEQWRAPTDEAQEEPPPAAPVNWRSWNDDLAGALDLLLDGLNQRVDAENRRRQAAAERLSADGKPVTGWAAARIGLADSEVRSLLRAGLAGWQPPSPGFPVPAHLIDDSLQRFADDPRVGSVALLQVLVFFDVLMVRGALSAAAVAAVERVHRRTGKPGLLDLAAMLDAAGLPGRRLVTDQFLRTWNRLGRDWPADAVWPFFAGHVPELLARATVASGGEDALAVFQALSAFPVLPAAAVADLYAWALGPAKALRAAARDALAAQPDRLERAMAALTDGRADTRRLAADWLAEIGDRRAIPALAAAASGERKDAVIGAMLDALSRLGADVAEFLDRPGLPDRAATAIARGLSKDLMWLDFTRLPQVRWADSGEPVELAVVQWLADQAVRGRSSEPNAILRHYCGLLEPTSRTALGQAVLEGWLAHDLRPVGAAEASARAEEEARNLVALARQYPASFPDLAGRTVAEVAAGLLPRFAALPAGSAIASKGLLALAAACAGRGAAPLVSAYLTQWYGTRLAQGKALLGMLAWIEHPSATHLLVSVAGRFRTRGLQLEAARLAEALAERRGWTVEELADRTIPTAGFDAEGVLRLSYGLRIFTAHVGEDLGVELRDPAGAPIKALPTPRAADDPDLAAAARKDLAAAKKELRQVDSAQRARLYEALCSGRTWDAEEWRRSLLGHPVMRLLIPRLVWMADTPGGRVLFRPLADGTLTNLDEEEVELPGRALVGLAHALSVPEDTAARWREHLADYAVTPLFQQFDQSPYRLPAGLRQARDLAAVTGHLIEAFRLRTQALKLGYVRGQAEDGGWFYDYRKPFNGLGLTAVIGFTGNPLPEQNRLVALTTLRFDAPGGEAVELSQVPAILLSETYHDLRQIAAQGSGFDPDWQEKSEYR